MGICGWLSEAIFEEHELGILRLPLHFVQGPLRVTVAVGWAVEQTKRQC